MIKFEASQGNKRLSDYAKLREFSWKFFDRKAIPANKYDPGRQSMLWEHQ